MKFVDHCQHKSILCISLSTVSTLQLCMSKLHATWHADYVWYVACVSHK